ncbi:hypothetical protein HZ326_19270 [Fusarium oxysporum f. sp. albedinis]|nr:hypothetical protein HZ326_19270 [Fusarium oxysporum f. sp. albedinis]
MILHVLGKDFCRQYMLESCCGMNESYSELASPETRPPETHHICKPPETLHCACNFQGQLGLLLEDESLELFPTYRRIKAQEKSGLQCDREGEVSRLTQLRFKQESKVSQRIIFGMTAMPLVDAEPRGTSIS